MKNKNLMKQQKKIRLISLVMIIFVLIGLSSCNTEKTCTCTTTSNYGDPVTTVIVSEDMTKKDCEGSSSYLSVGGITVNTECKFERL